MAANHFAALVDRYRNGRSDRRIAADGNINLNWLAYPLRPGTTLRVMPDEARIGLLAAAIGAPIREVREAFENDVYGEVPYDAAKGGDDDPQLARIMRLAYGLDAHHRVTLEAMAKSLATLQRRTATISEREVG